MIPKCEPMPYKSLVIVDEHEAALFLAEEHDHGGKFYNFSSDLRVSTDANFKAVPHFSFSKNGRADGIFDW